MRVLFDTYLPFGFAHGGVQVRYEQTVKALAAVGVESAPLAWWSDRLDGDVVHYFGRPTAHYIAFAHAKGLPVVFTDLMGALAARPRALQFLQHLLMRSGEAVLPAVLLNRLGWQAFKEADGCVAQTAAEAALMIRFMGAPQERVHVVPNGVDDRFQPVAGEARGKDLICVAALRPLKRVVEVAEAALRAGVPIRFVGKPYADDDAYYRRFMEVVGAHDELVYEGAVRDREVLAGLYRQARGFVLLSTMESYSIASAEAAACGCPLLLSDLAWARSVYGESATYCSVDARPAALADCLRSFYDAAPGMPPPPRPLSWADVAGTLKGIYESVLTR